MFKFFKEVVENKNYLKIKFLRSNNGGEYTSNEFEEFYEQYGIRIQFSAARYPKQNALAKRKNKNVHEMVRTMLNDSKLSDICFWTQAIHIVVHILSRGRIRVYKQNTI